MSLPSEVIRFGEWLPDLPALNNPGMTLVENALPTVTSYTHVRAPEYRGDALDGRVLAAHWTIASGGDETAVFAGTPNSLYRQSSTATWTNVSRDTVNGYGNDVERWEMAAFGSRLIAVSLNEATQYYDVGTSTNFADLPGAPQASAIGLVRDFVVLGNISSLGENYVQWSGFNNSEAWTPSRTTQSDFQPLASNGGRVQAIVSGADGFIFLENTVYRMVYIGPPRIFRLDEISPGRGTLAPKSVVRLGPFIYYYDAAGFYRMDVRSGQFTPIGHNKVDRWFANNVPSDCVADMQAGINPKNKFIVWTFCIDATATANSHLLFYHYELKRWSLLLIDNDYIAFLPEPSASLDDLGTLLPLGIDMDSINVDSDLFAGSALGFQIFGTNHKIGTLTGEPLRARFTTAEHGASMNNYIYTNLQRPYVYVTSGETGGRLAVNYRDSLTNTVQSTAFSAIDASGLTYARVRSRFQQYHLEITGGFDDTLGLEVFRREG